MYAERFHRALTCCVWKAPRPSLLDCGEEVPFFSACPFSAAAAPTAAFDLESMPGAAAQSEPSGIVQWGEVVGEPMGLD